MDTGLLNSLQGLLPDPLRTAVQEYALRSDARLHIWALVVADQLAAAIAAARPYVASWSAAAAGMATPLLDRAARALYDSPDIVVLGALLVLLFFMLQVLAMMRRMVLWWTRMAFRVAWWSAVALLLAVVWQRGLDQSVADAGALAGRLLGYASFVRDTWSAEYSKYQQQQLRAQAAYRASQQAAGGGRSSNWSSR